MKTPLDPLILFDRIQALEERVSLLEKEAMKHLFEVSEEWIQKEARALDEDRSVRELENL